MAGESSVNATPPPGFTEYQSEFFLDMPLLVHIFITVVMLLSAACDAYFMLVLLINKKLRSQKENLIFVGNILFDLLHHINGFSVHYNIIVPMVAKPKCILVFLTMPGSGTIVFVTTIDRLIAVTFPLHYIRLGLAYAGAMVAAAFALTMPTFVIGWVDLFSYPDGYLIPNCDQDHWVTSRNFLVSQCLVVSTTATAAVIYVPIMYKVYRLYKHKQEYSLIGNKNRSQLLRTTTTVILLMLSHLGFLAFPEAIFAVMNWDAPFAPSLAVFAYIIRMLKGAVDIPIYFAMHKELRLAFRKLKVFLPAGGASKTSPNPSLTPRFTQRLHSSSPPQAQSLTLF